jgi:hypothetical protein
MEAPSVILLMAAAALHAQTGVAVTGKVVSTTGNKVVKHAVVTLRGEETYLCQSDANGQFSIKDVVPGRYEVETAHEGFQAKPEPAVTIGPGPATLELHLVPLALISGRVVDELGDPVPNAEVDAMHYRYLGGKKQLRSTARAKTNDRGEYLIADLAPSRYYVRASDPEHDPPIIGDYTDRGPRRLQVYAPAFYPGTRDPNRASMLSAGAGDELQHLDLQIHRESVYAIRGHMAPDTSVGLIRRFDEPAFAYATRSGGNGQFEIWGVTPGAYAVTGTRQRALYAMRKVDILNDDVDGVDLTNPTAIAVNGTVQTGGIKGLHVVLQSKEAAALDLNTPVQADGSFTVNAQPDNYVVHVQGDGVWLKSMRLGDREVPDHRFVPGRFPGPLTLVASNETGAIRGSVRDANGQPAAGVSITLLPDQSLPYWPDLAQVATTNGDGIFTLTRVIPGHYRLFALADAEAGAPLDTEFRRPFDDKGTPVQAQAGSTAEVPLTVIQMK